jgi:YVTN family beta-propeller protein
MRYRLLLLLPFLIAACGDDPVSNGPLPIVIPGAGEQVIYSKHIEPIFQRSCGGSGCHLEQDQNRSLGNDLSLSTWSDVMTGSKFGAVVVPYDGGHSHLLQHVNTDTTLAPVAAPRMPLGRNPLPIEQIRAIKQWIDQGAKNDNGEVALSGDRPRVFVTNQSEDRVAVIDLATERLARLIPVGVQPDSSSAPESPHNITMSPDGRFFYVNLIKSGSVEKYDAATFARLGSVQVGAAPAQIAVTRDGSKLYVSNFNTASFEPQPIHEVNTTSMSVGRVFNEVGYAPHGVTLSSDERLLYTTNASGDNISEIDLTTGDVVRRIPISPGIPSVPTGPARFEPYQGVIAPDGSFWVTCRKSGEVRVVDLAGGTVVDSIKVGRTPLILAITPDGKRIWVPNQGDNSVSILDVAARTSVGISLDIRSQPHAVAFTADGKTAFVSCENQNGGDVHHPVSGKGAPPGSVYVFDISGPTQTLRRRIETAGFAAGIAVRQ